MKKIGLVLKPKLLAAKNLVKDLFAWSQQHAITVHVDTHSA